VVISIILEYLSPLSFFGPTHNWRENILEEFFLLQLHLNMSYSEVKSLPIRYRHWYLKRLAKHFKEKNDIYKSKDNFENTDVPITDLIKNQ
jgi:hypothetical protein